MTLKYGLDAEQVAQFRRDGFIGPLPSFIDAEQADTLSEFFLKQANDSTDHPLYRRFSVRDWHLINDQVFELLTHRRIVDALMSLVGDDVILWRSKVFHKRPADGEIGWHQEWGYFNGEEIGNDKPALLNPRKGEHAWDWTVWIALQDVTEYNGALQFFQGSQTNRYPIEMVPMTDSGQFYDPFPGLASHAEIVKHTIENSLVVDIDTAPFLKDVNVDAMSVDELKAFLWSKFREMKAAVTLPFETPAERLKTLEVKRGEFVIFTERCMHRSFPNQSDRDRFAINARYCLADTLVYPGRLSDDFIDGSNLDISQHRCIRFTPGTGHPQNVYLEMTGGADQRNARA